MNKLENLFKIVLEYINENFKSLSIGDFIFLISFLVVFIGFVISIFIILYKNRNNQRNIEFKNFKSKFKKEKSLKCILERTRKNFIYKFSNILSKNCIIDDKIFENFEAALFSTDIGVRTCDKLLTEIRKEVKDKVINTSDDIKNALKKKIHKILSNTNNQENIKMDQIPHVVMIVGVNGVGKTTTIGKIAKKLKSKGKSVIFAAGDTFRAAAFEQLNIWAKKTNSSIFSVSNSIDPASVLFETVKKAQKNKIEVVLCDTAGRMHTKTNLMDQLKKMYKVLGKASDGAPHEILLVIDATTGQNAIMQVKKFLNIIPLTGLVLTKLDGTAKGGIIIGIVDEFNIPIKYIGVGEMIDDLHKFNPKVFVKALFEN